MYSISLCFSSQLFYPLSLFQSSGLHPVSRRSINIFFPFHNEPGSRSPGRLNEAEAVARFHSFRVVFITICSLVAFDMSKPPVSWIGAYSAGLSRQSTTRCAAVGPASAPSARNLPGMLRESSQLARARARSLIKRRLWSVRAAKAR